MPMRAAPHTHRVRPPLPPPLPPSLRPRLVTLTLYARLHVGTTRTFAHSRASDISRPSVRWKSNSIWRRKYGGYSHPPLSPSLYLPSHSIAPFYSLQTCLSVGFPDAEFDFAMCAHSRVYRKCKLWRTRA